MLEDSGFSSEVHRLATIEMTRIKNIYNSFFFVDSSGQKELKPEVTIQQLNLVNDTIKKITAIYKECAAQQMALNAEKEDHAQDVEATRQKILSLQKTLKIELPKVLKGLYGI
jgi:flagellar motility protein MotE (MotC chaperone)